MRLDCGRCGGKQTVERDGNSTSHWYHCHACKGGGVVDGPPPSHWSFNKKETK
jgi:hypothetical protein